METVLVETTGGVATITMNRPDVLNAFDITIASEMAKALGAAAGDRSVRCIVITGSGRGFSAGADLAQLEDRYRKREPGPIGDILRERYHPVIEALVGAEKPVVAAVNGVAAGMGASLALACDFRIASDKARFFQAFIKIGLIPDSGATYLLPRVVGTAKALELAMTGDIIDAQEALRLGLVTRVVPHEDLAKETQSFAEQLAAGPSRAFGLTRRAIHFGAVHDLRQTMENEAEIQMELASTSPDHMEGVLAFLEKRAPTFEGR